MIFKSLNPPQIGLGANGITVEETVKSVVQAFQEKDAEIQRQKVSNIIYQ